MNDTVFRLSVPALPDAIRVIRSVANAAAAEANLGYDSLDDLSLAIDEAGGALLDVDSESLVCTVAREADRLAVIMTADTTGADEWPAPDWRDSLGALVLSSIATDVDFNKLDGRPAVSFTIA